MLKYRRRVRVAVTLFAAASMLVPADAQAFFGCFQKRQNAAAALYGGTVCNPCGQQLVCNYVPQTCYRTQTVAVPVTTMKPSCGTDPCTGCPTTVMRPVVSYQQQVQYVPYQSYRLQYSVAQPACPTATTSYYAPTLSSGVAAPTATYAAPTTTYAAPAAGCSSCNSGVATTSYYAPAASYPAGVPVTTNYQPATNYAPVPTTRMLTPGVVVPSATTYAAPNSTGAYNYPTTAGNVNVGGYSYATPGASGIAAPSMYGGTSSFTPAASAPANSAPGYATSNYGSPTMATPSYSGSTVYSGTPAYSGTTTTPSYSTPSTVTTVPSLSGSTYSGSTYSSSPTGSTYSSGSTLNGTTLSSAAPLSSSAVSGSVNYAPSAGMVPVPNSTLNMPAPPSSSIQVPSLTSPNPMSSGTTLTLPATPTTPAAPTRSGYSSGVVPNGTSAPTGPIMQPIPDPNMRPDPVINRELRMGPTSTPALVDPDDKTASTWRPMRAWDYQPVGNVVPATYTRTIEDSSNAVPAAAAVPTLPTTFATSQPVAQSAISATSNAMPNTPARLGAPRPAMEIEVMYAPQAQYVPQQATQPAVDRDGWRSSSAPR